MTIDIQVTESAGKSLKKVGQSGGLPMDQYKELLSKIAHPDGFLEPKGSSGQFYGIDLGYGHRALFVLNDKGIPVLFFAGKHEDYDKISDMIRKDPKGMREKYLSEPHKTLQMPRSSAFNMTEGDVKDKFFKAIELHAEAHGYGRKGEQSPGAEHRHRVGRVGGAIGVAVGIGAAATQAAATDGRAVPNPLDFARAAWEQTAAAPLTRGRFVEAAIRVMEMMDPTQGLATAGIRNVFQRAGLNIDPGMLDQFINLPPGSRNALTKIGIEINKVNQIQQATLNGAGLSDFRDSNGQRINVATILRDPQSRETFMNGLQAAHDHAKDPAEKDKIRTMIDGCHLFLGDESHREILLAQAAGQILDPAMKTAMTGEHGEQGPSATRQRPPRPGTHG